MLYLIVFLTISLFPIKLNWVFFCMYFSSISMYLITVFFPWAPTKVKMGEYAFLRGSLPALMFVILTAVYFCYKPMLHLSWPIHPLLGCCKSPSVDGVSCPCCPQANESVLAQQGLSLSGCFIPLLWMSGGEIVWSRERVKHRLFGLAIYRTFGDSYH